MRAHSQEYRSTITVLVAALDSDVLPVPEGGACASTKDFTAALPSAVKHQALRDAHSVWKRACDLGRIPVLRKPVCQCTHQNWRIESHRLLLPIYQDGTVQQMAMRCARVPRDGTPGVLRSTRTRSKWIADIADIADIARTLPAPEPRPEQGIMGVDLGIKLPAGVQLIGKGTRDFGNGR